LTLLDILITFININKFGIGIEVNPYAKWAILIHPVFWAFLRFIPLIVLFFWIGYVSKKYKDKKWIPLVVSIILAFSSFFLVVVNVMGIYTFIVHFIILTPLVRGAASDTSRFSLECCKSSEPVSSHLFSWFTHLKDVII
jgi:hypothetical protein